MKRQAAAAPVLTIGQLARATGVTAKTIRYYEAVGVLPPPSRSAAGYRLYDPSAVERLRFVRRARALGLPLRDLKTLVVTLDGARRPGLRSRLLALVRAQLAAVRDRSAELRMLQQHLQQTVRRLLKPPPVATRPGGCRCLDPEDDIVPTRRRAPRQARLVAGDA